MSAPGRPKGTYRSTQFEGLPVSPPVSPPGVPASLPDAQALRGALGRFATGVSIITCLDAAGARVGLTANSFGALSLEPPLVLWSLRVVSPSLPAFEAASHFAVNVLAETQVELSRRFASPLAGQGRFDEGSWAAGLGGAPVLAGCAAVFECERLAAHDGGDHRLFIGRVLRLADLAIAPLIFQGGHYHMLGEVL
jgi:flavin reductase (DIM6/NTAB) family NADH-FMN oxidoreductase RutF